MVTKVFLPFAYVSSCLGLFGILLFSIQPGLTVFSGTTLDRLWESALEFQKRQAAADEGLSAEIDGVFKKWLWKNLLKHDEVILRSDDQVLHSKNQQSTTTEGVFATDYLRLTERRAHRTT